MSDEETPITWATQQFGLDNRIVKACKKAGWVAPTLVQQNAIPLILQGKDVLCRARTGSGKTAAYLIPLLQKILVQKGKSGDDLEPGIRALVLVPTNELCHQVNKQLSELTYYCSEIVSMISLAPQDDANSGKKGSKSKSNTLKSQAVLLRTCPDIVVSTPARANMHLTSGSLELKPNLMETLIVDEADLVLSFGHGDDMIAISAALPQGGKGVQGILMSATLSPQLHELKKLVLHSPALIKLEDGDDANEGKLLQFFVTLPPSDKYLLVYVFLRLGLLQGKGILFVNSIDEAYKLRLFLSKFSIRAAALNSELPLTSRTHILDEFNRDIFDLLIATDEGVATMVPSDSEESDEDSEEGEGAEEEEEEEEDNDGEEEDDDDDDDEQEDDDEEEDDDEDNEEDVDALLDDEDDDDEAEIGSDLEDEEPLVMTVPTKQESKQAKKQSKAEKQAKKVEQAAAQAEENDQYGVARGIDFKGVKFVINVDMPRTVEHYIHRVGRTARAGANGTSLTLVSSDYHDGEYDRLLAIQEQQPPLPTMDGSTVLAQIGTANSSHGVASTIAQPAPLAFSLVELDTFRYRVEDMLRTVTKTAVREERSAELKREIMHSDRLSEYFSANPNDLKTLRHDKRAVPSNKQNTLHLSRVPEYLIPRSLREIGANESMGPITSGRKRRRMRNASTSNPRRNKSKDPLQSFTDESGKDGEDGGDKKARMNDKIYTKSDDTGMSMSGRRLWKMKHKKGEFSKKRAGNTAVTGFAKGQSWVNRKK